MRSLGEPGSGSVEGFTGGFGIDGRVRFQLKAGLLIGEHFRMAEQSSELDKGEFLATWITDFFKSMI